MDSFGCWGRLFVFGFDVSFVWVPYFGFCLLGSAISWFSLLLFDWLTCISLLRWVFLVIVCLCFVYCFFGWFG